MLQRVHVKDTPGRLFTRLQFPAVRLWVRLYRRYAINECATEPFPELNPGLRVQYVFIVFHVITDNQVRPNALTANIDIEPTGCLARTLRNHIRHGLTRTGIGYEP